MALGNFRAKYGLQVADSTNTSAPSDAISGYDILPVGSIMYWAGPAASIPAGWLLCDGRAVTRTAYPNLNAMFSSAGYLYGSGDGSTTFNLPDGQGRALQYSSLSVIYSGVETRTLQDSEIIAHTHPLGAHSHPMSSHTHSGITHSHTAPSHSHSYPHNHPDGLSGDHSHNWYYTTPTPTGSGQVRNSTTPATTFASSTPGAGSHTHGGATTSSSGTTGDTIDGGGQSNPPAASADTNTAQTGDASPTTTGYNGVSTRSSFSLMQPYLVASVIIKAI